VGSIRQENVRQYPSCQRMGSGGEMDGGPQQARHRANGLADDPGKGRHSESVRGMEVKMIPSLFVFLGQGYA
jgi:hypothetical protein